MKAVEREHPMSNTDLEKLLGELRERLIRIEERLRPVQTVLSFKDAASRLGIGLTKLREMEQRGHINSSLLGRRKMISLAEIERVARPVVRVRTPALPRGFKRQTSTKEEAEKLRAALKQMR